MKEKWECLYETDYGLKQPDKRAVSLIPKLRKKKCKRVLDLGCGIGRHMIFFEKKGFLVVGSDFSSLALKKTQQWAKKEKLKNYCLVEHDITQLPFPNGHFDCVISITVIYHNTLKKIKTTVEEIKRVLSKNGILLVSVLSKKSFKYGTGKKIEKDTHVISEGGRFHKNIKIVHHFFDESSLRELFSGFRILKVEEIVEKRPNNWPSTQLYILAQKR